MVHLLFEKLLRDIVSLFSLNIAPPFFALLLLNVVRMKLTGHEHCHHHDHCDCCEMEHSEEHEFVVKGMNCNHCKANVEKAVGSIPGVKEVKVDLKSGRMSVSGDDVEHEKIRDAVESIGFSLED